MSKRSRNWVLTNNYKEITPITNEELLNQIKNIPSAVYTAFQLEQGEQGTQHHQIYVSFKNAKTFEAMKNIFPNAHIEQMISTIQHASDYCTKEDSRIGESIIWGEIPTQGKRTDMEDIYDMLNEGATFQEIRNTYPSQYIRYKDRIHSIKQELLEEQYQNTFRILQVIYLSDTPGIGKTKYIMEKYGYENVYRISDYKNPFDAYKGEDVIIFEEFRESIDIVKMLMYLDGYPLRLPARYSDKIACFTKVYIVSNWLFRDQYTGVKRYDYDTYTAFTRRISFIGNLEDVIKFENNETPF